MGLTVLFVGFGAVAKCCASIWPSMVKKIKKINMTKAVIVEPKALHMEYDIPSWMHGIYTHIQIALDENNYKKTLDDLQLKYKFDLVVDLSVNVDGLCMVKWVQENKILYVNTALEDWESYKTWNEENRKINLDGKKGKEQRSELKEHTLIHRHIRIKHKYFDPKSTTAIVESGANPGIISVFAKLGLLKVLYSRYADNIPKIDKLRKLDYNKLKNFAVLAYKLGLQVIHIAELDTQKPKESAIKKYGGVNKCFLNTWSCKGYVEESIDPTALGKGSHEKITPGSWLSELNSVDYGYQMIIPVRSMNVFAKSIIPDTKTGASKGKPIEIKGRVISHGESASLCEFLQIKQKIKGSDKKKLIYRPSVYYVYSSSEISQLSLKALKKNNYKMQESEHVLNTDEIASGKDTLGTLLIFSKESGIPPFYSGTVVDLDYVRNFKSKYITSTTIQVMAGIFGAINYMLKNKNDGVNFPEVLPIDETIKLTKFCLGKIYCNFMNYEFDSTQFEKLAKAQDD